jgi:hypothetical protein
MNGWDYYIFVGEIEKEKVGERKKKVEIYIHTYIHTYIQYILYIYKNNNFT